jgi:hypothetical protein
VEVHAAVGSNLYADPIKDDGRWVTQTKLAEKTINGLEETSYQMIGGQLSAGLQPKAWGMPLERPGEPAGGRAMSGAGGGKTVQPR